MQGLISENIYIFCKTQFKQKIRSHSPKLGWRAIVVLVVVIPLNVRVISTQGGPSFWSRFRAFPIVPFFLLLQISVFFRWNCKTFQMQGGRWYDFFSWFWSHDLSRVSLPDRSRQISLLRLNFLSLARLLYQSQNYIKKLYWPEQPSWKRSWVPLRRPTF